MKEPNLRDQTMSFLAVMILAAIVVKILWG